MKKSSKSVLRVSGHDQGATDVQANWSGVLAMSLCVFTLVASEFMPVSLLTPLSQDLTISEGEAGQGIAISGALAVLTSLSIRMLAGKLDRKILLMILTVLMAVSGVIVALTPNYSVYMLGRGLLGIVIGGFWSISAATAMRLVPTEKVAKALAIFNGGNALAVVIAAPLGSYLGSVIGWRGAFLCLTPIAILALIWQGMSLPSMNPKVSTENPMTLRRFLRDNKIAIGISGCGLFFLGQFSLYTYIRPFLEGITHVDVSMLSMILLLIGIFGVVGTSLIGLLIKRNLYRTLCVIPLIMSAVGASLLLLGAHIVPVIILLSLWGLVATSAPVGWWAWIARVAPAHAEVGGGLMVAVVQFSIALGSTLGGALYDRGGFALTFSLSMVILIVSALLTYITSRLK